MGIVGEMFKKYVAEKSNGEIEVQTFYSGSLGDETETIHNVRRGTLALSCVGIANTVPFVKQLGILNLPYLFENLDEVVKATNGKSAEILNTYAEKAGFRVLAWTYTGFRYISNSKRPITKMVPIEFIFLCIAIVSCNVALCVSDDVCLHSADIRIFITDAKRWLPILAARGGDPRPVRHTNT